MNNSGSSIRVPPPSKKMKTLKYKEKDFVINFDLLVSYSEFFDKNKSKYENVDVIDLSDEELDNNEINAFPEFINMCQFKYFQLDDSNVLGFCLLFDRYQVPDTENMIANHFSKNPHLRL